MKRKKESKKRILGMVLAVMMVVTMLPAQTIAAASPADSINLMEPAEDTVKTKGQEASSSDPAVSVKWMPDTTERVDKSKGTVALSAFLEKDSGISSAAVEVRLDSQEAAALTQFRNEEGELDEASPVTTETKKEITLKKQKNGDVHLCFGLSKDSADLEGNITFQNPEDATEALKIEVTEDDIVITPEGEEALTELEYKKQGGTLFLEVPEKKSQQVEGDNSAIKKDNKTQGEAVKETTAERQEGEPAEVAQEKGTAKKQLKINRVFATVLNVAMEDLKNAEATVMGKETKEQDIFWSDNNNEADKRPGLDSYSYGLSYAMKDSEKNTVLTGDLTKETDKETLRELLDLTAAPSSNATQNGGSRYLLRAEGLPTAVKFTDQYGDTVDYTIEWEFKAQNTVSGYSMVDVMDSNIDSYKQLSEITETGWYYMLNTEYKFNIGLRQGDNSLTTAIGTAIQNHFELTSSIGGLLEQMNDTCKVNISQENSKFGTLTYSNLWKYNLDGARVPYDVNVKETIAEADKDKITISSLEENDYFALSYDNSQAPNYGTVTDKIHDGGTLYLTLTGKTGYEATKEWLDTGVKDKKRPTGTFQLWRYRSGEAYTTAAPVRNEKGEILTCELDTEKDTFDITEENFGITLKVEEELGLEKYDPEGYKYYYVAREYLDAKTKDGDTADNYEKVFGKVIIEDEQGKVTDTIEEKKITENDPYSRSGSHANNTFLYDGGTLSNRIVDNINIKGVKEWKAASFQAAFEDVSVVMTVQSRPAGTNEEWKNTAQSVTLDDFYAENLGAASFSKSLPRYNAIGEELEYRWAETSVTQGGENLLEKELGSKGEQYFTLKQNGEDVRYQSVSKQENGETVVTNSIANTVRYDIVKKWMDADGVETDAPDNAEVTFGIYRSLNGKVTAEPVAKVTMDGTPDEKATEVQDEVLGKTITVQETKAWFATVKPLAEYDEEGRQYEYLLLEMENNTDYVPTYETVRGKDEQGKFYKTTVTNAPGKGNRILVRKEWTDDSDIIHREPVKIGVYVKETVEIDGKTYEANDLVATTTLNEANVWFDLVGIGMLEADNVYILETKMGDTKVPLSEKNAEKPEAPAEYSKDAEHYTAIQFDTKNHKYEATYYKKTLGKEDVYTVNNRRLGTVDLTAEKIWIDGNGEKRVELKKVLDEEGLSLALYLDFANQTPATEENGYEINRSPVDEGDWVSIANNDKRVWIEDNNGDSVSSVQKVFFDNNKKIYFHNLPKYDQEGQVVNYDIREVIVDKDGEVVQNSKLPENVKALWSEYQASYKTNYTPGKLHSDDNQNVEVTNRLQGTKNIGWHKEWKDDYTYKNGQRPDIYLNIYQVTHQNASGETPAAVEEKTSLYQKDYKWTEDEDDKENFWHVELNSVPKYDALGYEIVYYATENTVVKAADFDYQCAAYKADSAEIGTEFVPVEDAERDGYVQNVTNLEGKQRYALKEDGTFVNTIKNTAMIQGQKVWSSLPAGYKEVDNLPAATFIVKQKIKGSEGQGKEIARLYVKETQWADLYKNGSYQFNILNQGNNTINDNGEIVSTDNTLLPKYDEYGRLYTYELSEEIDWPDAVKAGYASESAPDWETIFEEKTNTYHMENAYKSPKGALKIKKILALSKDDDGNWIFPAVDFELTRTYTGNDGKSVQDTSFKRTAKWSSSDVKAAAADNGIAEWEGYTFENLELYAPNGSKYVYSVKEVKGNLNGFDTWAVADDIRAGDVKLYKIENNKKDIVSDLTVTENKENGKGETADSVTVAATFINERNNPQEVTLTGTKVWKDYSNAFGFRPDLEVFEEGLTVTRYAKTQPGQGNGIGTASEPLTVNSNEYEITWTNTDKDTWTYTIKGKANSGELERYAPNGMPWEYQITEADMKQYTETPSKGKVTESKQSGTQITMNSLTNSILVSEPYLKIWKDSDGKKITEDYLGIDLTVSFQLQAADKKQNETAEWLNAEDYFDQKLTGEAYKKLFENYKFTAEITGAVNNTKVWIAKSFSNLPAVIKTKEGTEVNVDYRVVETSIKYDGKTQAINVINDAGQTTYEYEFGEGIFEPGTEVNSDTATSHTNVLPTTDITVEKKWEGDNDNLFGTRPETGRTGYDWETTFVIQKSTDGDKWESVKVGGNDLTITLYGKDSENSVKSAIKGLPKTDLNGAAYQYRVRELNTDSKKSELNDKGVYNTTYTVSYGTNGSTATNTLNDTKIYGEKKWNPGTPEQKPSVTLTLQYLKENGTWAPVKNKNNSNVTVTLNGETDPNPANPYYEYEAWKAIWEDLPSVLPGSKLDDQGMTQYRVVESVPSGYLQEGETQIDTNNGYSRYTFTNVQSTSFSVEKVWGGVVKGKQVVAGLYRTINDNKGTSEDYQVKASDGKAQKTVTLGQSNSWKGSFTGLPKYDKDGNLYTYYARELTIDGTAAGTVDYISEIYYHDETSKTKIVNVVKVDITGKKIWKDNGNAYNTRPKNLELTLYRQEDGSSGKKLVNKSPEWTKPANSNEWTYVYKDLPAANGEGIKYIYTVEENVPDPASGDDEYTLSQSGNNLTNTLTDKISISGKKVWRDGSNADGKRPESIKIELYANGTKIKDKTIGEDAENWSYTFENLDEYDVNGKRISYTVDEVLPEGYSKVVDDKTIINTKLTSLDVEKVWGGVETNAQKEVVVGLYRTTGEKDVTKDAVEDSGGNQVTRTLNSDNGWKNTFSNLPKYELNGEGKEVKYIYYARELTIGGDPVKNAGLYAVYNHDTENEKAVIYETKIVNVGKKTISGTKTWVDNGDSYKTRPENLDLTLTRKADGKTEIVKDKDGNHLQPIWADKNTDKWTYTYTDLPAADENGKEYTYTVEEKVPDLTGGDSYTPKQDGDNFTNTLTGTVEVSVEKRWKDGSDTEEKRPNEISIQLYKTLDGEKEEQAVTGTNGTITLNSDNEWSQTWKELPKYEGGKLIHYTVKELNKDGEAIENGGAYDSDYIVDYSGSQKEGYTASNTMITSQTVTKIWEGDKGDLENPVQRPVQITAQLYAAIGNGKAEPVEGKTAKLNEENGWAYTWKNLPKYEKNDRIHYTVKELDADNNPVEQEGAYNEDYTTFYAIDSETGDVTITNYHQPDQYMYLGQVTIRKDVVIGKDVNAVPQKVTDSFYVALFEDEELTKMATDYEGNPAMKEIKLNGTSSEEVIIDNMPVGPTTHPVTYYVAEVDQDGIPVDETFKYQASVANGKIQLDIKNLNNKENPAVITNTFSNKVELGGTKTWAEEDQSARPQSIEVVLQQNGQDYVDGNGDKYIKTVTAEDDWKYIFENLPEYDENGIAYEYSVKEGYVDGYTSEVTGMDILNIQDYEGYYYEGTIRITKEVMLKSDPYNVKDVYYAGIFNDKNYTDPLTNDDGTQYVVPLILDDESETTIEVSVPFNKADSAEYYVTEVDENGVPVDKVNGLQYKASVKGEKIVLDMNDTEGSVKITNTYQKEKVGKNGGEKEDPNGRETQTGDNSNMMLLFLVMLTAAILMGILAINRKRRN